MSGTEIKYSMELPQYVRTVLNTLSNAGVDAYVVGGCVRDYILGKEIHDYDMAACTTPDILSEIFSEYKCIETGKRYGTITVLSDGNPIEITCARCDGEYLDGRRPENVKYTKNIEEDLKRRDFTINAMAYSEKTGIIDLYNGIEDVKNGIIRAVGVPKTRFEEDGLRIMRALRFSSTYNFKIEEKTDVALRETTKEGRLDPVSVERISVELVKLLCGDNVKNVLIEYSDIICRIIPEFEPSVGMDQKNPYHIYTVYDHIANSVSNIDPEKELRLVMLFHDIGKPYTMTEKDGIRHFYNHNMVSSQLAYEILKRLKFDNETINNVTYLVKNHDRVPQNTRKSVHRYLSRLGIENARKLMKIRRADSLALSDKGKAHLIDIEECESIINLLEEENVCLSVKDLCISGSDLIGLGISPGPEIGHILSKVMSMVVDEKIENNREELLDLIKNKFMV